MADGLRASGWVVHSIVDYFPNDAQETPDEAWLAFAQERGWVGLTQDRRLWVLSTRQLPIFCLHDGNLGTQEKVRWFVEAEAQIMRLARLYKPGMWIVHEPPRPVRNKFRGG